MFRAALPRLAVAALAALALVGGASRLIVAQPAPTPPGDAGSAPDQDGGPAPRVAPPSDPLPPASAFDAQLTAVLRSASGEVALVGRSGQLYVPDGDTQWRREGSGGVSTSVQAMYRAGTGKLYAVGDRAPLFARKDGLWAAYPLARKGSSAASTGSLPIIALRRKIFELGATGWRSTATAPASVKHLWAASPSRLFLSDFDGQAWSTRGAGWQRISMTLAADEHIVQLHGVSNALAVALTSKGRLFSLARRVAKPISTSGLGADVQILMLGAAGGKLLAIAQSGEHNSLVEVGAKKATTISELWPLEVDDHFTIIAEVPAGLLVATERGQARIRLDTQNWRNAQIQAQPPGRVREYPNSGPANAR